MEGFLILSHLLTNFELQKNYQNEAKFNVVCSRNNLPKITDGIYVTKLDDYKSIVTHWRALYVNGDNVTYFDSFRVEHIPKDIKNFTGNKNITINIYRIQVNYLFLYEYFCIKFIDFKLKGKSLLDQTNLFSPNEYEKKDKIILQDFI